MKSDIVNAVPSAGRIPIAVSKTIDPSGQHDVVVFGTARDIVWGGRQKRAALERELRIALSAADYKVLLDAKSKSTTRLSAKRNGDLDETWVAITVKDGSVGLHSIRSQIPKVRSIGEGALTPEELALTMLRLDPPAPRPESITDVDDFPFLRHIPGLDLLAERSRVSEGPFVAIIDGQNVAIDGPVVERYYYQGLIPVSTFRSLIAYKEGLTRAGWEIVRIDTGPFDSIVELFAHYQKDARDIWAHITVAGDNEKIQVADPGAALDTPTLTRRLTTDGRVTLYGIHFDSAGILMPRFKGSLDRLAPAIKEAAKSGARYSVFAHVEEREGPAAAAKLAAAAVRELLARGVPADEIDAKGADDLPDRRSQRLPSKAYFEIMKR